VSETVDRVLRDAGPRFTGAVTAGVTHEIKNCLAILKELCGLMGDLAANAARKPLDPAKFGDITGRAARQIGRADEITRVLNRFAHLADPAEGGTDVFRAVETVVLLSRRSADMRGVGISLEPAAGTPVSSAGAFDLAHLVHLLLRDSIATAEKGRTVVVSFPASGGGPRVRIAPGAVGAPMPGGVLPALLQDVGAALETVSGGGLELVLPGRISPAGGGSPSAGRT
jgi:hypothetical protein